MSARPSPPSGRRSPMNVWHVHSSPYGELRGPMDNTAKPVSGADPDQMSQIGSDSADDRDTKNQSQ